MENLTFSSYLSCANPVLISEMKGDECSAVIACSADGTPYVHLLVSLPPDGFCRLLLYMFSESCKVHS